MLASLLGPSFLSIVVLRWVVQHSSVSRSGVLNAYLLGDVQLGPRVLVSFVRRVVCLSR